MTIKFSDLKQEISSLFRNPDKIVSGHVDTNTFHARTAIPDYGAKISEHYAGHIGNSLADLCQRTAIPFGFSSFGLVVAFDKPQEIELYNEDFVLDDDVKDAIRQFGPVILRHAYMSSQCRSEGTGEICQLGVRYLF